jgi:hypothetical protein
LFQPTQFGMRGFSILFSVVAFCTLICAQPTIPGGTVIPVRLDSALNSKKSRPGQIIRASVAQDVPLDHGAKIKAGTRILGKVLAVTRAGESQPATISLRFDEIDLSGKDTPVLTNLRALASPLDVSDAQTPKISFDRGSPPWAQTVNQIGGDVAYRGSGTVERAGKTVGKPVFAGDWGVLSQVSASPGEMCRGAVAGNDRPQALWVFSQDACGVYGYDAVIQDAGRSDPKGEIVLASTGGDLLIRRYSGMLLRVNSY